MTIWCSSYLMEERYLLRSGLWISFPMFLRLSRRSYQPVSAPKTTFSSARHGPWILAVSAQMAPYTIILYVLLVIHVSKLTNESCKAHCNSDDIELSGHACILLIKKLNFFSSAMLKKSFRILCWSIVEEHERRWHWWRYLDQNCCVSVWGRL